MLLVHNMYIKKNLLVLTFYTDNKFMYENSKNSPKTMIGNVFLGIIIVPSLL